MYLNLCWDILSRSMDLSLSSELHNIGIYYILSLEDSKYYHFRCLDYSHMFILPPVLGFLGQSPPKQTANIFIGLSLHLLIAWWGGRGWNSPIYNIIYSDPFKEHGTLYSIVWHRQFFIAFIKFLALFAVVVPKGFRWMTLLGMNLSTMIFSWFLPPWI